MSSVLYVFMSLNGYIAAKIEQARAEGLLGDIQALDVALTYSALAQGLVSMHRARRFSGEAEFTALYHSVMRQSLTSLKIKGKRKAK